LGDAAGTCFIRWISAIGETYAIRWIGGDSWRAINGE
jgi:hypothetical protein